MTDREKSLLDKFNHVMSDYVTHNGWTDGNIDDRLFGVYVMMFGCTPHRISLYNYASYMKEHLTLISKSDECVNGEDKLDDKYDDLIIPNTMLNIRKALKENDISYIEERYDTYPIIITENGYIFFDCFGFMALSKTENLPDYIENSFAFCVDDESTYQYLSYDKDGFTTMPLQIKNIDIDLDKNYNSDIPYDEIVDFLNSDESGLVVMHGIPGTGKSMIIRHLITTVDREFIYLDGSAFDSITDASFIKTLAEYENGVLILEDCENMLTDRLDGNNKLAALLNLTDGLLGDSFKFKIICTFNAGINKIDKALLRKGRLKIKYEFKELTTEKVKALSESLGKDIKPLKKMTLADIYNYGIEVDKSSVEEKNIGFM